MTPDTALQLLAEGAEHFNAGRYFEAHEAWEQVWLASAPPSRTFLQGLIQLAAAWHQSNRQRRPGALRLFQAGLRKLEPFPANFLGLDRSAATAAAAEARDALASGSEPPSEPPRIALVPPPNGGGIEVILR